MRIPRHGFASWDKASHHAKPCWNCTMCFPILICDSDHTCMADAVGGQNYLLRAHRLVEIYVSGWLWWVTSFPSSDFEFDPSHLWTKDHRPWKMKIWTIYENLLRGNVSQGKLVVIPCPLWVYYLRQSFRWARRPQPAFPVLYHAMWIVKDTAPPS